MAGTEIVPGIHAWALLGDGRYCETWLAWSVPHWAPVAIKLPRPDCLTRRASRALRRESRTIAALAHPAVQRLLGAHCADSLPHLIFEYVEGPTLADLLDERGGLAPADVVRLGMQIASALHYIHGRRIVHCDLKPSNLVLRDGRIVLIDFDIARTLDEGGTHTKARGSAEYMAPEQIYGAPAAPSMDLFALGAVLYEAVTDTIAFGGGEPKAGRGYKQLTQRPAPLRAAAPTIPGRLQDAIWRLLEPDPQRRPATAMAALSLLARALPAGEGLGPGWTTRLLPPAPSRMRMASRAAGKGAASSYPLRPTIPGTESTPVGLRIEEP